jgi:enhancer of polycomb-like protein
VFRQRDKEKRWLRKKRQNEMEAYRKMRQLRADFERVGRLCDLILRRERVNSTLVELSNDYYEERMHRWTDTTGLPRRSRALDRSAVEGRLDLPRYFDDRPIAQARGGSKRKRGPQTGWRNGGSAADGGRAPSPAPDEPGGGRGGAERPAAASSPRHDEAALSVTAMPRLPPRTIVVAGHDGGFPAPNFLQPLASRESHFATVDGACTTSRSAGPGGAGWGPFPPPPAARSGGGGW